MSTLSSLTELTTPSDDDLMLVQDVSDLADGATGTSKKMQLVKIATLALTWAAAQIFNAAVSLVATQSTALLTINQSGTGDIATFQDAGTSVVRVPDQGGVVFVPQAGGFQVLTGLVGYDNTAAGFRRLKFQHEDHPGPVPIDPRNGFRNSQIVTTYP